MAKGSGSSPNDPLGQDLARSVAELYVWAMGEGLRGVASADLFDGYCRRLVEAGVSLWRGHVSSQTLHPQWSGYGFTWRRLHNAVREDLFVRAAEPSPQLRDSPFYELIGRAVAGQVRPTLRRKLAQGPLQRDFPVLAELHAEGGTDYFATVRAFGENGDPAHGTGVVFSFVSDSPAGFATGEIDLIEATLPGLALALKANGSHLIASNLLDAYLGRDAGRRVHAGAIARGETENLRAVIFYADLKGFTAVSDQWPGQAIVEMLDAAFETLAAPLRTRGGQVLKFIGDAMLATFAAGGDAEASVCEQALDAAEEALEGLAASNAARAASGLPTVDADIALHLGDVLYGNIGAADRLDFTVIGPAVNEVARLEKTSDHWGRSLLASQAFAHALADKAGRLAPLGTIRLRGVAESQTVFGLANPRLPTLRPEAGVASAQRSSP